jgi:hypothetical protein
LCAGWRGRIRTFDLLIQSQDLSVQSVELATPLTDRLLFADLLGAYTAELDRQCSRGSGASGELLGINQVSGINAVTYTDATPTVPELYPKVADPLHQPPSGGGWPRPGSSRIRGAGPGSLPASTPRAAPLVVPSGEAFNAARTFRGAPSEGGEMQGVPL